MPVFQGIEMSGSRKIKFEAMLNARLEAWESRGLGRELRTFQSSELIDFSSNDYLGLARREGAEGERGTGASRLVTGNKVAHEELETQLASWLGRESALLFTSGYAANVGVLSALIEPGDLVFSDALNHASIIDGIRLAKGTVHRYAHCDLDDLAAQLAAAPSNARKWVVSESVFSMDGDGPDVERWVEVATRFEAFSYLDEAHALGAVGVDGKGRGFGLPVDVTIGTFGKSFGSQGAFVAGASSIRRWMIHAARSFVFSTGISELLVNATLENFRELRLGTARTQLNANVDFFAGALHELGLPGDSGSPIFPIVVGDAVRCVQIARALADRGFLCVALRPPTVAKGTSRLRIAIRADHREEELRALKDALKELL